MTESNRTAPPAYQEPSLVDATLAVKDAVVVLGGSLAQTLSIADRTLMKTAHEHPYLLLGGAAGAGFVAGGGLAAPITRSLMRFGFKTASAFMLDAAMRAVAPMMSPSTTTSADPRDPSRDDPSPPVPPGIDIDAASATSAATTSTPEAQRRETSSSTASSAHHVANP